MNSHLRPILTLATAALLVASCDRSAPEPGNQPESAPQTAPKAETKTSRADLPGARIDRRQPAAGTDVAPPVDWPRWGGNRTNNMISGAKGIPLDLTAGEKDGDGKVTGAERARWVALLGSQSYGTPTIHKGRVLVGTNNDSPRIESIEGDRGILYCLDEKTGELQWQFTVPKLPEGQPLDYEFVGICSSALIDDERAYIVTNRCEIVCLDLDGQGDGNDGPFQDEGKYLAGGLSNLATAEPLEVGPKDADIVWGYDMRNELGVLPHNITSSSVVMAGGKIFATTSNGVDFSHINTPEPEAPCLIALNKDTGELLGEEASGISKRLFHCNWSSPGAAVLNGKETVVFGAGDGYCYGFDANEFDVEEDGGQKFHLMKELWKVNCCPNSYRFDEKGEPIKYATYPGPSEIVASPVIYDDKVYVTIGQDPEDGDGVGCLTCFDPAKGNGDDAIVWQFKEISRSVSTPSVVDGLVYAADFAGIVYCLDAATGELYWQHDSLSHIWSSTMVADGKVLVGNEDGELIILKAGKEHEELATIEFPDSIYSTAILANDTLYIQTMSHLYAFDLEK
ncbi:MAG: PQQ-binding-like beta-propeller repeat protein [Verrucomicrobiae bacterium]|nr:PQQ-binding-like beta-propeller repeat protein [Verrucomicrobiae bacterium]MCP5540924.1 PQQ-binding-like beta-propeller repeat protein [Akkermansiaceae bacterium]